MLLETLRHEAHVWAVKPESIVNGAILDACMNVLSEQELQRLRRFRFPEDQHRFLVSHALVRTVLSKYVGISPKEWVFSSGSHGKPVTINAALPDIRFNLSHTRGLAACLVSSGCDCGIDVEKVHDRHDPIGVAERMFSIEEISKMRQLKGREQLEYFFLRWTLREAFTKALGTGISFPTRKLNFRISPARAVEVEFEPEIEQKPENWQFETWSLAGDHIAAAAFFRPGMADKPVVRYRMGEDMDIFST